MKFDLDAVFVEHGCADSALAARILRSIPRDVPVTHIEDGREVSRAEPGARDPFGAGKRRMVIARRKTPFLMACPAGSSKFACCGYLVLTLASNCPMDCCYCFLQEYLADNPAFQVYANYADAFGELDRLCANARGRSFRVGTGELADSLAFDSITGDEPRSGRVFLRRARISHSNSKPRPTRSKICSMSIRAAACWFRGRCRPMPSIAAPSIAPRRPRGAIAAARAVLDAGYRVAFHLDPLIAYPEAERDYLQLIDELLDNDPARANLLHQHGRPADDAAIARRRARPISE